jgi:hypothetical protein
MARANRRRTYPWLYRLAVFGEVLVVVGVLDRQSRVRQGQLRSLRLAVDVFIGSATTLQWLISCTSVPAAESRPMLGAWKK